MYQIQDIEFTIENRVLHILQTRNGKRTARAGVTIAVGLVKERLISEREALLRIEAKQMDFFLHAMIDQEFGTYCVLLASSCYDSAHAHLLYITVSINM